jgi:putative membrane protein
MYRSIAISALAGVSLLLGQNPSAKQKDPNPVSAGRSTSAEMKPSDTQFIQEALAGGRKEVELAQRTVTKAIDTKVQEYARRLIGDHKAANAKLEQIASNAGVATTGPSAIDHNGADRLDPNVKHPDEHLFTLSSTEFDKAYIKQMVEDHQAAIARFEAAQKNVSDARLRGFISATLPTLRQHLRMAQSLEK